mmetsp:Transcript_38602/g.122704  ORF Transcript_38602/g.122704 Transcript_38602/m.122704 type:complete len:228 (-) Transcript_38602:545-1228(-)
MNERGLGGPHGILRDEHLRRVQAPHVVAHGVPLAAEGTVLIPGLAVIARWREEDGALCQGASHLEGRVVGAEEGHAQDPDVPRAPVALRLHDRDLAAVPGVQPPARAHEARDEVRHLAVLLGQVGVRRQGEGVAVELEGDRGQLVEVAAVEVALVQLRLELVDDAGGHHQQRRAAVDDGPAALLGAAEARGAGVAVGRGEAHVGHAHRPGVAADDLHAPEERLLLLR